MTDAATIRTPSVKYDQELHISNAAAQELITILLEELVNLLDELCDIHAHGDVDTFVDQQAMTESTLDSLMLSLNMTNGDALAINLRTIYSHVRKLIGLNYPGNALLNARAAHQIMSEISSSWGQAQQVNCR